MTADGMPDWLGMPCGPEPAAQPPAELTDTQVKAGEIFAEMFPIRVLPEPTREGTLRFTWCRDDKCLVMELTKSGRVHATVFLPDMTRHLTGITRMQAAALYAEIFPKTAKEAGGRNG